MILYAVLLFWQRIPKKKNWSKNSFPVSVLSPYQLDDKTFVEYHADPSAKVTLYYALDAGLGNQVKYQTEPLRDLYEGIFAKSFTLFYGETLQYYFE